MTFFNGHLFKEVAALAGLQELICIKFMWTQDVIWKTCKGRWVIKMGGERERESGKSIFSVWFDDDDDDDIYIYINIYIKIQNKVLIKPEWIWHPSDKQKSTMVFGGLAGVLG